MRDIEPPLCYLFTHPTCAPAKTRTNYTLH